MGSAGNSKKTGGSSKRHRVNKQKVRGKFCERHIDQVFDDMLKGPTAVHDGARGPVGTTSRVELDDDLPGGGQHYCMSCSRYFVSDSALQQHAKTKPHKRRLGEILSLKNDGMKPHNQLDAESAGGLGAPDNGRPLRSHAGPISMDH